MNLCDNNAHFPRGIGLQPTHELARLVDRQFIVLPDAGRRKQLYGVMMLGWRFVFGFGLDLCCAVHGFGIAGQRDIFLLADILLADTWRVEGRARLFCLVSHMNPVSRFGRGFKVSATTSAMICPPYLISAKSWIDDVGPPPPDRYSTIFSSLPFFSSPMFAW